jgi:hypothetical protein
MDCWIGKCADRIILKDGQSSPHEQLTEKGHVFCQPFRREEKVYHWNANDLLAGTYLGTRIPRKGKGGWLLSEASRTTLPLL